MNQLLVISEEAGNDSHNWVGDQCRLVLESSEWDWKFQMPPAGCEYDDLTSATVVF